MIMKRVVALLIAGLFVVFLYATDYTECFLLNSYFNETPTVIHGKISEYEKKLQKDADDYYANLAIAILYSALSSPMDNPERGASDKIVEYSKRFEKAEANNPLAMTYYGLGCSLVSRDSNNPITQLMQVKKAIKISDEAVKLSANRQDEWFIRYMRANFYINLPDTFKKRAVAESDFELIYRYYESNPDIEPYMCNGYYHLGEIEKSRGNLDQAVLYWKLSVALNNKHSLNSKESAQAAKRLAVFAD